MLRIGKQTNNRLSSVRLPPLGTLPGMDNLRAMLTKAQRNWRVRIEQPFKYTDPESAFVLTLKCETGSGEPCWMLYHLNESGSSLIWSYMSADIFLLRNLVHTECAASTGAKELPEEVCALDAEGVYAVSEAPASACAATVQPQSTPAGEELPPAMAQLPDEALLTGDLSDMQLCPILQSMATQKLTGRLELQNAGERGDIFVEEGILKHAATLQAVGDPAALELLTWQKGSYHFYTGETFLHTTIKKKLDLLCQEGESLSKHFSFLASRGVNGETFLTRKNAEMSEQEFQLSLLDRTGCELADLKLFYNRLDCNSTVDRVLSQQPMPKAEWVPILSNLISRDLVIAADCPPGQIDDLPDPIMIEQADLDSITKTLCRPETGILSYQAMLYFVKQEFLRFRRGGLPFSILVFSMNTLDHQHNDEPKALPIQAVREIAVRIRAVKRELDLLGHFEQQHFALLLPHTDLCGAAQLVERLERLISGDPLMNTIHSQQIRAHFGAAAIPEDIDDPNLLLAFAKQAMEQARQKRTTLALFRDSNSL